MNRLLDRREFGSSTKKLLAGLLAAGAVDLTAPKKAQANFGGWHDNYWWYDHGWSRNYFTYKTYGWQYPRTVNQYFYFRQPAIRTVRFTLDEACWDGLTPGWRCEDDYELAFRFRHVKHVKQTIIICPCHGMFLADGHIAIA